MGTSSSRRPNMNQCNTNEIIKIESYEIKIPRIQSNDVGTDGISFEKPSWTPDDEVTLCFNCQQTFTRLRRKHHCRNCGKIFCYSCCNDKVVLLQFGIKDAQRVCISCKTAAVLVSKSRSEIESVRNESAFGLSKLVVNIPDLCKLVESGGLYIMLSLALEGDVTVKAAVASAMHCIAQHSVLNSYLVEAGCLKIFRQVLTSCNSAQYLVLTDTLGALSILCEDENIKLQALRERLIDPLLVILNGSGTPAIFASRIMLLLFDNLNYHDFIVKNHTSVIPGLLKNLRERNPVGEDFHILEATTKMLVHLTAGSEAARHILLQEDEAHGSPLVLLLKHSLHEILLNISCIIANLATASKDLHFAHKYIAAFCELLDIVNKEAVDIIAHLGRGLANFSEYPTNTLVLVQHLPSIVSTLLRSNNEAHRYHACRIIIRLLSTEPTCTLRILTNNGIDPFLGTLFSLPGVNDMLNTMLLRKVSRLSISQ